MAKRKLTTHEIVSVHEWALAREHQQYPDAAGIEIIVHDETDDNGDPRYAVIISRERIVPRNQVPF